MNTWNTFLLSEPNNIIISELYFLHEFIFLRSFSILLIIFRQRFFLNFNAYTDKIWSNSNKIELIWTFLPVSILIFLIIPSIRILYLFEEPDTKISLVSCKVIGHQWYWSYQITDSINNRLCFSSYIINRNSTSSPFYLLEVDNRLVLPFNTKVEILLTRKDVVHSWSIPSLGFKIDAIPGRLNLGVIRSLRPGVFWGQCSELCGVNHSFIPIMVEFIRMRDFKTLLFNLST